MLLNEYKPKFNVNKQNTVENTVENTVLLTVCEGSYGDKGEPTKGNSTQDIDNSAKRRTEIIKLLIDNGANYNAANRNGRTALLLLCEKYDMRFKVAIDMLLDKNVDITKEDVNHDTALDLVCGSRSKDDVMINKLLSKGSKVTTNTIAKYKHISGARHGSPHIKDEIIELLTSKITK
jgi:ankyrin repeat protein